VFRIRIGLNTDSDPAFEVNTDPDPDPAFEVNTGTDPDPGNPTQYRTDPDPGCQINTDPHGSRSESGSETLKFSFIRNCQKKFDDKELGYRSGPALIEDAGSRSTPRTNRL